jgi:hypothetical protein
VVSGLKKLVHGKWAQGVRVDYSQDSGSVSLKLSRGRLFLLSRQLIAASVVIGLLGVLAGVIYKIVSPEQDTTRVVANVPQPKVENRQDTLSANSGQARPQTQDTRPGEYLLKLTTADFAGVDSFINRLLEESTWLRYRTTKHLPGQSIYRVYCSRTGLEDLMTGLTPVWSRFDSANVENQVAVEQVKPEQVADIAKQKTNAERMRVARDFAVSNDIHRLLPQEKILALEKSTGTLEPELTAIPKPVLTSSDKGLLTAPKDTADQVQVDLSIVLSSRK